MSERELLKHDSGVVMSIEAMDSRVRAHSDSSADCGEGKRTMGAEDIHLHAQLEGTGPQ